MRANLTLELSFDQLAVAVDRLRAVLGQATQVEALVRTARVAPAAGGEHHPRAGQLDRDVLAERLERRRQPHRT